MSIIKELNYKIVNTSQTNETTSIKIQISESQSQQMYLIHKALKQQLNDKRG